MTLSVGNNMTPVDDNKLLFSIIKNNRDIIPIIPTPTDDFYLLDSENYRLVDSENFILKVRG